MDEIGSDLPLALLASLAMIDGGSIDVKYVSFVALTLKHYYPTLPLTLDKYFKSQERITFNKLYISSLIFFGLN